MEIKKIESLGQTQTEEQKKQQREKITKLMLNPTQEAEKALIGASLFKYISPIEQEIERDALSRKHNQELLQKSQERITQQQQNHKQMLIDVQVEAMRKFEAEKQQVNVDAVIDSHAGTGTKPKVSSKLEKQQAAILEVIKAKGFKPMAIPDGEKSGAIQRTCENTYATLFKGSTSFDRAWNLGRKSGLWKMEHHESYARRGNN
jgi:hypothetical protein